MSLRSALRRRLRTAALLPLATVLLVAGCASSGEPAAPAPEADGPSTFPVRVDHAYGTTQIPAEPRKVIALGLSDQDPLLALGVKPIAVSQWYGDYPNATWPWAQDELGDAKPIVLNGGVRNEEAPPLEEIASLQPDLILSLYNGTTKEQYDQLSRIAPTVVPDQQFTNFTITWQEAARATGEALGREQEAVDLVKRVENRFTATAAQNPQFAGKTAVVAERFEAGASVVRSGNDVRAQFFSALGFTVPGEIAGIKPDKHGEIDVSDELMSELSKDLLVWNIGSSPEVRPEIENSPVYKALPVTQQDKVLWLEDPVLSGAFSWGTILSLDYALDELVPLIRTVVPQD